MEGGGGGGGLVVWEKGEIRAFEVRLEQLQLGSTSELVVLIPKDIQNRGWIVSIGRLCAQYGYFPVVWLSWGGGLQGES